MKQVLIVYKSKYGATKKYAEMLAEALPCDVWESGSLKAVDFSAYDSVVFAGAIYASGIAGLRTLHKHYPALSGKQIAVLCVGASPWDAAALADIKKQNLTGDLQTLPLFYARGAWDEGAMSLRDRALCGLLQKVLAKRPPDTCEPWMKALLEAKGQKCDWTSKQYLEPLVAYLQGAAADS